MSTHSRKISQRVSLPRRNTRNPLDSDDPLSASSSTASPAVLSPALSRTTTTASKDVRTETSPVVTGPAHLESPAPPLSLTERKDFSFILDPAIYHNVSQLEVPALFRRPFPVNATASASLEASLNELDDLLSQCDFLGAAFVSGNLLGSGKIAPHDGNTIFHLLATRYSCLELSNNVLLAAQEAKALEDLGSAFYYEGLSEHGPAEEGKPPPRHVMPFALRLQALRLQSIGFSDPRRGVSALYDVGLECRENIASDHTSDEDRQLWVARLEHVGLRVINALVEMGDLDCARRTLQTVKPAQDADLGVWTFRMVLICLKLGLVDRSGTLIGDERLQEDESLILNSLLSIANDHLDNAAEQLSSVGSASPLLALAKQNLAVALLYKNEIDAARSILSTLIDENESFSTLTINLATLYDLSSDKSRDVKIDLASRLAEQERELKQPRAFTNADFKL